MLKPPTQPSRYHGFCISAISTPVTPTVLVKIPEAAILCCKFAWRKVMVLARTIKVKIELNMNVLHFAMSEVILPLPRNALCAPLFTYHKSTIMPVCIGTACHMLQWLKICAVNREGILIDVLSFTGAVYWYLLIILETGYEHCLRVTTYSLVI